jgi:HK97 family phage major capsid protein
MAVKQKNREAAEFQARALTRQKELQKKLADPEVKMTTEELATITTELTDLRTRAQLLAGFTPEEEIEDQGGDELLRRAAPDSDDPETKVETEEYQGLIKQVRVAFGGPNSYLLELARSGSPHARAWSPKMRATHERVQAFHQRTIIGDANDASGGEFLLPLQQVESIFTANLEQPGIFERARKYPVRGRTIRIPLLDQTDAANTRPMAGIAAITIVGEGGEKPLREPQFIQRLMTIYKWAAYTELGDEVLADDMTGDLAPTIQQAVGGQIVNEINGYCTIDGSGTAMPLGALHASNAALKVVNRQTSQSVTTADVFEMDARFVDGPGSFWLAHVSLKPAIYGLTLGSNTLVSWLTDLRSMPVATLLGKPIVWTHLTSLKGVKGDLALINPAFYAAALRQALTVESSIHYKFRNDITAYRFFARAGGIPIPTGTYSYKAAGSVKTYEVSPFVVLGDDATS